MKSRMKRVWLKLDGCDLKLALQESQIKVWNGDCNLGDGKLEAIREEYDQRHASYDLAATGDAQSAQELIDAMEGDLLFLREEALPDAVKEYQAKL